MNNIYYKFAEKIGNSEKIAWFQADPYVSKTLNQYAVPPVSGLAHTLSNIKLPESGLLGNIGSAIKSVGTSVGSSVGGMLEPASNAVASAMPYGLAGLGGFMPIKALTKHLVSKLPQRMNADGTPVAPGWWRRNMPNIAGGLGAMEIAGLMGTVPALGGLATLGGLGYGAYKGIQGVRNLMQNRLGSGGISSLFQGKGTRLLHRLSDNELSQLSALSKGNFQGTLAPELSKLVPYFGNMSKSVPKELARRAMMARMKQPLATTQTATPAATQTATQTATQQTP